MISSRLVRFAVVSAALAGSLSTASAASAAASAASGAAPARHTGTRQTHHCKMADGTMDMTKTHKACLADKGTWVKDAASAPAAASMPDKK